MIFSKFSFGKTANRRFNYIPRYYDADKEEFKERVRRARAEVEVEVEAKAKAKAEVEDRAKGFEDRIRSGFQHRNRAYNNVYNSNGKTTLRVALIASILFAIFYLIFNSGLIDRFFIFFLK